MRNTNRLRIVLFVFAVSSIFLIAPIAAKKVMAQSRVAYVGVWYENLNLDINYYNPERPLSQGSSRIMACVGTFVDEEQIEKVKFKLKRDDGSRVIVTVDESYCKEPFSTYERVYYCSFCGYPSEYVGKWIFTIYFKDGTEEKYTVNVDHFTIVPRPQNVRMETLENGKIKLSWSATAGPPGWDPLLYPDSKADYQVYYFGNSFCAVSDVMYAYTGIHYEPSTNTIWLELPVEWESNKKIRILNIMYDGGAGTSQGNPQSEMCRGIYELMIP